MVISKLMTSQQGKQVIKIYILPKILRRKGNQAMKFGQLIEYNMRNIFLQKVKCGKKALYGVEESGLHLRFYLWIDLDLDMQTVSNCIDPEISSIMVF